MAEAAATQPAQDYSRALNMGESKAVARKPQIAPAKSGLRLPTFARPEPAPAANQAAADPLAQAQGGAMDPVERLTAGRQASKREQAMAKEDQAMNKAAGEKSEEFGKASTLKKIGMAKSFAKQFRDPLNRAVDRTALPMTGGFLLGDFFSAFLGLSWFNLKLIWGSMVTKGKSKYIAPPTFKSWRIPILPDTMAKAAIVLADIFVMLIVFTVGFLFFALIAIMAIALTDGPVAAVKLISQSFGVFTF